MITPKIYPWKRDEIVDLLKKLQSLSDEFPQMAQLVNGNTDVELPDALIQLVARMIESVAVRLNRVPEKALLQFLSFADKNLILAEPARVPVKFKKALRAEENPLVPRRTQVSTLTSDFSSPMIFETTAPLTVVEPDIKRFVVVNFDNSTYEDKSHCIETILETPEKLYKTSKEFEYKLHIYHPILEEINGEREYWLQVVLNFDEGEINQIGKPNNIARLENAEAFNKQIDNPNTDYELFDIKLQYIEKDGTQRVQIIRDYESGINNLSNYKEFLGTRLFLIPVKVKSPIKESCIEGISSISGLMTKVAKRFITVSMIIHNREYFNYFEAPKLTDAYLRLFYLPQITADQSSFITDKDSKRKTLYEPEYEDVTNIERAFYNDTEIDLSKPFYPFGKKPELNDTFYFSSKFFSCAGEVCEINMWLLGDLAPSWMDKGTLPFADEQVSDQKADTNNITLGWEYFNGQEWVLFGKSIIDGKMSDFEYTLEGLDLIDKYNAKFAFKDGSNAFTTSASMSEYDSFMKNFPFIQFRLPEDISKTEVNRVSDWWIRVRILKGGYSTKKTVFIDLKDENTNAGTVNQYSYEITECYPPIIRSFTINYTAVSERETGNYYNGFPYQSAESILTQNDFYANSNHNAGSLETSESFPVMSFNSDYDLNRINTECVLYIGFNGSNIPKKQESLFFSVIPDQMMIAQDQTLENCSIENVTAILKYKNNPIEMQPDLQWEYWSSQRHENRSSILDRSNGWRKLQINDRTIDLTAAQSVEFTIPEDAQLRTMFNEELYWIRVAVKKRMRKNDTFDFEETVPSYNDQIRIAGLHQNTVIAESLVTVNNEILGSSNGAPDQTFYFSSAPIASEILIMIREPVVPSQSETQNLVEELIGFQPVYKSRSLTKEQFTQLQQGFVDIRTNISGEQEIWVRWIEVPDFLNSLPESRHVVVNHGTGTITFGNGVKGRIPDIGINSIEAKEYRFGGSDSANIVIGEIKSLVSSIPYIEGVTNIAAAQGGRGFETNERVSERGIKSLACGNRAVTIGDYELLIRELSGGLLSTKAFSCRRPDGISEFGWTTIAAVINQKGTMPLPSFEFLKKLEDYLSYYSNPCLVNRLPQFNPSGIAIPETVGSPLNSNNLNGQNIFQNVRIVPPNYIGTMVETDIEFDEKIDQFDTVKNIKKQLDEFLHVTKGGPDRTGWEFGRDVYKGEIYKEIRTVPGVKTVRSVALRAHQMRIALPVSGMKNFPAGGKIPEGSLVNVTYLKHSSAGDVVLDYTFSFLTAQTQKDPVQENRELIVLGFKEGDVISVKGYFDVSHRSEFSGERPIIEQEIGRSRIRGIEPVEYKEIQQTSSGGELRALKFYRLYIEPMALKIPGQALEIDGRIEKNIKSFLSDDTCLSVELFRDRDLLTGQPKTVSCCIKGFISLDDEIFYRINDPDWQPEQHKKYSSIRKEEFKAIDVAVPDFRGTPYRGEYSGSIYPFGIDENAPHYTFVYDNNKSFSTDYYTRCFLLHEYTDRVFINFSDIPYSLNHLIKVRSTEEPFFIEDSFLNKTWELIENTSDDRQIRWDNTANDSYEEEI